MHSLLRLLLLWVQSLLRLLRELLPWLPLWLLLVLALLRVAAAALLPFPTLLQLPFPYCPLKPLVFDGAVATDE